MEIMLGNQQRWQNNLCLGCGSDKILLREVACFPLFNWIDGEVDFMTVATKPEETLNYRNKKRDITAGRKLVG